MMEILALCAPWILLILVLATVVLLRFKKWKVASILFILAVIGNWHFRCVPVNFSSSTSDDGEVLKVMSFNCNLSPRSDTFQDRRDCTLQLIIQENPDIIFLTENFIVNRDSIWYAISEDYPYRTLKYNIVGNCIYSKYPITEDSLSTGKVAPFGILYCTIDYKGSPLNVVGCHLSSNNYNEHMEYLTPDNIEGHGQAKTYLGNIMKAGEHRQKEARQIVDFISKSNNPTIAMGDFNDVCGSPTLNVLERANLKDAWWEGGFGYGATIHKPLPYRIDHILYREVLKGSRSSNCLRLRSIKKIDASGLSDHDVLVAEFYLE